MNGRQIISVFLGDLCVSRAVRSQLSRAAKVSPLTPDRRLTTDAQHSLEEKWQLTPRLKLLPPGRQYGGALKNWSEYLGCKQA